MNEMPSMLSERVDDIPLVVAQMRRMELPSLIDSYFVAHGNRQGLSVGWTATVWLAHILSHADHRLNQVQPWVERRVETLRGSTGQPVRALDLSDDRLAALLRTLADDGTWVPFERAVGRTLLRVYDLRSATVRVDTTTASSYGQVSEESLFQFGHSKDHRPDLPQVKVLLATLDPLGLPVATMVVSGEQADDPLYRPAITQARSTLGQRGLLYVGDCKMGAVQTRAAVVAQHDYYLCPLAATVVPPDLLDQYLQEAWAGQQPPTRVERPLADGTVEHLADVYERSETLSTVVDGWQPVRWTERRLLVRSLAEARRAEAALRARLRRAQETLSALTVPGRGKRRWQSAAEVEQAAAAVLADQQVEGLLQVQVTTQTHTCRVRAYGACPARTEEHATFHLSVTVDEEALVAAVQRLGWRVYATNQPAKTLSAQQAVLAYREEYLVERGFGRLKGQPLSLSPLYLQRDDHVTGLIRLLSLALRVLTLVEYQVRRRLAQEQRTLAGLYAGQPTRATARPTTERLLGAFKEITLTVLATPQ
ncbi:MAG: IS1634 family transposase, partial [Chloroflexi bacterium]|nr:IS1634 family transposase [Chloroflexota bacterium]